MAKEFNALCKIENITKHFKFTLIGNITKLKIEEEILL